MHNNYSNLKYAYEHTTGMSDVISNLFFYNIIPLIYNGPCVKFYENIIIFLIFCMSKVLEYYIYIYI